MKFKFAIILSLSISLPAIQARADDDSFTARIPARIVSGFNEVFSRAQDLVLNALGMMGIPYRWGGTTPEAGFDCSGFVQYVAKQALGIVLPRSSFDQVNAGRVVERNDLQPGDLVFFNTLRAPFSHVGIYLGDDRFIHAPSRGTAVEIVDFNNSYWQQRYNGARRLPM
jgi:cell wall-associated NlpC family hydrolase